MSDKSNMSEGANNKKDDYKDSITPTKTQEAEGRDRESTSSSDSWQSLGKSLDFFNMPLLSEDPITPSSSTLAQNQKAMTGSKRPSPSLPPISLQKKKTRRSAKTTSVTKSVEKTKAKPKITTTIQSKEQSSVRAFLNDDIPSTSHGRGQLLAVKKEEKHKKTTADQDNVTTAPVSTAAADTKNKEIVFNVGGSQILNNSTAPKVNTEFVANIATMTDAEVSFIRCGEETIILATGKTASVGRLGSINNDSTNNVAGSRSRHKLLVSAAAAAAEAGPVDHRNLISILSQSEFYNKESPSLASSVASATGTASASRDEKEDVVLPSPSFSSTSTGIKLVKFPLKMAEFKKEPQFRNQDQHPQEEVLKPYAAAIDGAAKGSTKASGQAQVSENIRTIKSPMGLVTGRRVEPSRSEETNGYFLDEGNDFVLDTLFPKPRDMNEDSEDNGHGVDEDVLSLDTSLEFNSFEISDLSTGKKPDTLKKENPLKSISNCPTHITNPQKVRPTPEPKPLRQQLNLKEVKVSVLPYGQRRVSIYREQEGGAEADPQNSHGKAVPGFGNDGGAIPSTSTSSTVKDVPDNNLLDKALPTWKEGRGQDFSLKVVEDIFDIKCGAANLSYEGNSLRAHSHKLLEPQVLLEKVQLLDFEQLNYCYRFSNMHSDIFDHFFPVFCHCYALHNNRRILLSMLGDCERHGKYDHIYSVYLALQKTGMTKQDACQAILQYKMEQEPLTISVLMTIISESEWTSFTDFITTYVINNERVLLTAKTLINMCPQAFGTKACIAIFAACLARLSPLEREEASRSEVFSETLRKLVSQSSGI